jgi:predicted RND superfamily exporter protein
MHGDAAEYYRLPEDPSLSAQYLLLYEMSLPYGLDLNDQVNVDKSATRLAVTLRTLSVKDFLALEERAQAWLTANAPDMKSEGTSMTMMFAHIGVRNWDSMISGTLAALLLITVTISFAMRSLRLGLLSMIPNIMPVAVGFGVWALIDGQIGMLLAVAISMTLGIVVDDTVHLLSKYSDARGQRRSSAEAVRYAFQSVGTAVWVTTAVLVAGFLVLTLSAFELNADLGLLTAITIAAALLCDYLFLPPLLMTMEETRDEESLPAMDAAVDGDAARSRG